MIEFNSELDTIAREKCDNGCRDALKKASDHAITNQNPYKVTDLYLKMAEARHMREDLNILMVRTQSTVWCFYNKSVTEVEAILRDLKPGRRKMTDPALTRMLHKRVSEIYRICADLPTPTFRSEVPRFRTEVDTVDGLFGFCEYLLSGSYGWKFNRVIREMKRNILSRPELRSSHVKAAFEMIACNQVMDS